MNQYSLIVDHLPQSDGYIEQYLDVLSSEFSGAEAIIVAVSIDSDANAARADSIFELLEKHGARPVPAQSTRWETLNLLAATAKSSHLLVLEEDWWPSAEVGESARNLLEVTEGKVHYFHRRDAKLGELPSLRSGRYVRSTPRPTDNPGFAYLIERRTFLELRGYDERAGFSGAASIDFNARLLRSGIRTTHLDEGYGSVYHFPEIGADDDGDGARGLEYRRQLHEKVEQDPTIYRNLKDWSVPFNLRVPLITVAIATKDRGDIILDSVYSVLYQSFQDFEIVVVDDGSEDDAARIALDKIGDPRIRYVRQEQQGVSAARNRASDLARCRLIAVHDDDDIMLPDRLELGIASLTSSTQATFGGWVNFSDETGEMRGFLGRVSFNSEINSYNGQGPGHSTWTVPTNLLRTVRYDERITASVDHNIASRLEWAGVNWTHTGKFMYLRRVHEKQITAQDDASQKTAHILTRYANNLTSSSDQRIKMREVGRKMRYPDIPEAKTLIRSYAGYLPDKLVHRSVSIAQDAQSAQFTADLPDRMQFLVEDRDLSTGRAHLEGAVLEPVTLADLAQIRRNGLTGIDVRGSVVPASDRSMTLADLDSAAIERDAEAKVSAAVSTAVDVRTRTIMEQHLQLFPHGCVVVIPGAETYHRWVDFGDNQNAVISRRILAAGEFGYKQANVLLGYTDIEPGMAVLAKAVRSDPSSIPYIVTLGDLASDDVTIGFVETGANNERHQ